MSDVTTTLTPDNTETAALRAELELFRLTHQVHQRLGTLLELQRVLEQFAVLLFELVPCQRVLLLMLDRDGVILEYGACYPPLPDLNRQTTLEMTLINIFNTTGEPVLQQIKHRHAVTVNVSQLAGSRLAELAMLLEAQILQFLPIVAGNELPGIVVMQYAPEKSLPPQSRFLPALLESAALYISNARQHSQIVQELATTVYEMNILQQIDTELNETIDLNYVFRMIMDWGLRFTSAHAAGLGLYDHKTDSLRVMVVYGYENNALPVGTPLDSQQGGITLRVARSGEAEVIPDVYMDKDYYPAARSTRSQLSVPIFREEHVIGVLTLESNKLNGFTENHLNFARSLTGRAGVAVDNARLFAETNREREKLALIVRNITDIVIVVDTDGRIIVLNHTAAIALRLDTTTDYSGKRVSEVLSDTSLLRMYQQAQTMLDDSITGEAKLPNERVYHVMMKRYKEIGWIIVLQDITYFKEMDQLKSELVAQVSHDLKQPLSIMRGYLDLLQMTNQFDDKSQRYMDSLDNAFYAMRQLIDDLLNMAHIESGLELTMEPVNVRSLLLTCVDQLKQQAQSKAQRLTMDVPADLPPVIGDITRLGQIFTNLIGNAVKYTQPEGSIKVYTGQDAEHIIVYVQDNGLGISQEDQAHIFERFYRVRRPETDSIEGTGLGLAIVKSLVEAHHGRIELQSETGKGSTFSVTLPLHPGQPRPTGNGGKANP